MKGNNFSISTVSKGLVVAICLAWMIPSQAKAQTNNDNATTTAAPSTAAEPAKKTNIKYKSQKDVEFENLLIQGQLKRPDLMVVTGDVQQGGDGLIRLRKDFIDRVTSDFGEEIQ